MSFMVSPFDKDVRSVKGLTKLPENQEQKQHMNALVQHIPAAMSAATLSECYVAKFPDGLQHALVDLKQGGQMSMYQDASGHFAGTASLYKESGQASFLGMFTAMAAISGQYYLTQINENLSVIKMGIDKILEFLYGDKKAELLAEVSFVKYAYENYSSIITHEAQRFATVQSLQDAKKIAMKDIEFYMNDLDSTVKGKDGLDSITNKAFQIKESLDLSIQLYGMSSILEVYYSQNFDANYLDYVENDISVYIDKCEKRILSSFSMLSRFIGDHKGGLLKKVDKAIYEKAVEEIIDLLNTGEESDLRKSLRETLRATTNEAEYYLTKDGDVYLKTS